MIRFVFLFLALCFGGAASAQDAAGELQQLLSQTTSFSAAFHQQVRDEDGELLQESRGDIVLQRPYKMHWETREPFRYLVVTDGETLWRYDPDLEQLNTEDFSEDLANTPVMVLVSATEQLAQQFTVSRQGQDYKLVPKVDSAFTELTMTFSEEVLSQMTLRDQLGQETVIELDNAVVNAGYSDNHFVFTPPQDAAKPFNFDEFGSAQ